MNTPKSRWQLMFAAAIFVAFFVAFFVLIQASESSGDIRWTRWTYVFGSIEAIALTVVGWILAARSAWGDPCATPVNSRMQCP